MKKLKGIIPPISTPLDENRCVDESALRNLVNVCIDQKFHGIFVCGTNGEAMALRQKEREKAFRITLEEANGRVPVLAGCMDSSAERVIDNIKAFEQMGGTTVVVSPMVYVKHGNANETIRLFEKISKNTQSDVVIYNIPPYTGYHIPKASVFEIAKFDRVIGYKDSSGQIPDFLACLNHFKGTDFSVLQGMLPLSALSMVAGADGFIPNLAPVAPEICHKIYEYGMAGDMEKAATYQALLSSILSCVQQCGNAIAGCKMAYSLKGLMEPTVCEPAIPVTENERLAIAALLEEVEAKRLALPF